MTWLIILGAWLTVAMALACALGRAIRLADDRHDFHEAGIPDDEVNAATSATTASGTFDRSFIPRPR